MQGFCKCNNVTQNMGLKTYTFFLDYYLAFILFGSQLWSSSVCEHISGYNIYTSPSVTVQRGLCVHVPCLFTVPSDVWLSISTTGIWYRLYNGNGYPVALKNHSVHKTNGSFFLTGNVYSGDCSYSIEDPLPTYEGKYFFRVEDGPVKFTFQDIQPYVNVNDSPSIKIIIEGDPPKKGKIYGNPKMCQWRGADTDHITAVNVTDGDSITMQCIVDSNPKASITWYKEDTTGQRTISDRTVTLTLSNITLSDAGRYRCSAENEHGAAHRTVEIIYHSPELQGDLAQGYIVAAAVGGVVLFLLIIAIAALLIMFFRKKKHQKMNENLKDMSMKDADAMYGNPECIMHNVVPPEDAVQKDLQSSQGGDLIYMNHGDVQYASFQFSNVQPKVVASEDTMTEYSEIKKRQNNY